MTSYPDDFGIRITKYYEKLNDFQRFAWRFYHEHANRFVPESNPVDRAINKAASRKFIGEIDSLGFAGAAYDEFFGYITKIHAAYKTLQKIKQEREKKKKGAK